MPVISRIELLAKAVAYRVKILEAMVPHQSACCCVAMAACNGHAWLEDADPQGCSGTLTPHAPRLTHEISRLRWGLRSTEQWFTSDCGLQHWYTLAVPRHGQGPLHPFTKINEAVAQGPALRTRFGSNTQTHLRYLWCLCSLYSLYSL